MKIRGRCGHPPGTGGNPSRKSAESSVKRTENAAGTAGKEKDQLKTLRRPAEKSESQRKPEWPCSPFHAAGEGAADRASSAKHGLVEELNLKVMDQAIDTSKASRCPRERIPKAGPKLPFVDRKFTGTGDSGRRRK